MRSISLATGLTMSTVPLPDNEAQRQAALQTYHILDTATEKDFDDLAELASAICQTPIALIGFVDDRRHWFKARKGTELTQSDKEISFCAHAIADPQEIMVVEDAAADPRFAQNPVVKGFNLAFYAGVPLVNKEGFALGTLCVFDQQARSLTAEQEAALKILGRQVMDKLELRRKIMELETANQHIKELNRHLEANKTEMQAIGEETAVINEELRTSNEEILSINENLSALNEEVTAINNELKEAYQHQEQLNDELTKNEQQLQAALEQTSLAKQAAQLGMFDLDVVNNQLTWDDRCKELFGVSAGKQVTYTNDFVDGLHPDDKGKTLQAVADAYNKALTGGRYDVEYRTVGTDDRKIRWVRAIGQVLFNEREEPQRFIGTVINISNEVEARNKLQESEAALQAANEEMAVTNEELQSTVEELDAARQQSNEAREMLDQAISSARIGTWHIDPGTGELTSSNRLKEIFGYYPDEQMPYDAAINHITDEYREVVNSAVNEALSKGESYDLEYPVTGHHDKKMRWVRTTGRLFKGEDGSKDFLSGIVLDITEQKQDEQRKNDFIGMVSHELKTPLTSMNGYIQMLLMKAKRNEDMPTANILDKANKQVAKMTTMINGFLNVTRLESGKIYIDRKVFDMAELVKETEEEFMATVSSHKVVFASVAETCVDADRDKIGQVINNFISNAVKYSPPESAIQVACVTRDGMAYVSVQDEGGGIAPEDQERLFERYYRVKGEHTKSIAGFGIGLYLSSEIIQRHQGQIGVKSEPGKGSTFWFTLPITVKA